MARPTDEEVRIKLSIAVGGLNDALRVAHDAGMRVDAFVHENRTRGEMEFAKWVEVDIYRKVGHFT